MKSSAEGTRTKPIITVYSGGATPQTKKFDNFVHAAFWIGVESTDGDLQSVKTRMSPVEDYDVDVASAKEFSTLLIERGISFSFEFFDEPPEAGPTVAPSPIPPSPADLTSTKTKPSGKSTSKATHENLKSALEKGIIDKEEYDRLSKES